MVGTGLDRTLSILLRFSIFLYQVEAESKGFSVVCSDYRKNIFDRVRTISVRKFNLSIIISGSATVFFSSN